jgi:hypothetical protein
MRHNQNRRSRGRNNRKGPNPLTRSYESNGPDVKVRGTAAHVADKYMTLARDAQSSGDTVSAENYLQHAEHYYRIVMAAQAQFQQTQPQFRDGPEDSNFDDDRNLNGRVRDRFDFNGADARNGDDEGGDDRFDNNGGGEGDDDRGYRPPMQQQGRPQGEDNRPRGPRNEQRYDRPRYDRDRQDRPDNRDNGGRDNGGRDNQGRDGGGRDMNARGERQDYRDNGNRPERFQRAEEPQPELPAPPAPPPVEATAPAPEEAAPPPRRRRGRPPRVEAEQAAEGETPDGAAALVAFPD